MKIMKFTLMYEIEKPWRCLCADRETNLWNSHVLHNCVRVSTPSSLAPSANRNRLILFSLIYLIYTNTTKTTLFLHRFVPDINNSAQ